VRTPVSGGHCKLTPKPTHPSAHRALNADLNAARDLLMEVILEIPIGGGLGLIQSRRFR
jgi:hypothetical protein